MVGLATHNLLSAVTGIVWAVALVRGLARRSARGIGSLRVDLVRCLLYIPAYAALQVPRVARARGVSQATVRALIAQYTTGRTFGVLGESRVNVLVLNLALDRLKK